MAAVVLTAGGIVSAILLTDDDGNSGGGPAAQSAASTPDCTYLPSTGETVKDVGTPPPRLPSKRPTRATIKTNLGTLELQLDAAKAPCTVNSLAYLAGRKFYDDTQCHRLTTGPSLKVLQCGDPSGTGSGGPSYRFADENAAGARYTRGTVAMANAGPDTNGSQFFIVYEDAPSLPPDYTVFGRVTSGMEIVDKVAEAGAGTGIGAGDGEPKQKITITEFRTA